MNVVELGQEGWHRGQLAFERSLRDRIHKLPIYLVRCWCSIGGRSERTVLESRHKENSGVGASDRVDPTLHVITMYPTRPLLAGFATMHPVALRYVYFASALFACTLVKSWVLVRSCGMVAAVPCSGRP